MHLRQVFIQFLILTKVVMINQAARLFLYLKTEEKRDITDKVQYSNMLNLNIVFADGFVAISAELLYQFTT